MQAPSTKVQPDWFGAESWWLKGLLAVLLAFCVAALWYQRDDTFARVVLGSAVLLLATGFVAVLGARYRGTADTLALRHEIDLHRRIFETSLDLILVTDPHGAFTRVSPSCQAILGYRPDAMVGHLGTEFIHPDDLEPTRNEMRLARRGREIRNFESRYLPRTAARCC